MYYLLLFHGNSGYANAPQCYVFTYNVLFQFHFVCILDLHIQGVWYSLMYF